MSLSLTETQILTAIRAFLQLIVPNTEIIRGQQNRATLPAGPNWIMLTPIVRPRLSTDVDSWSVTGAGATAITSFSTTATFRQDVQCDCFGPLAEDNATVIALLWRNGYAVSQMHGTGVVPLYHSDMRNLTFINDQSQYEFRWSIDLSAEIDPAVTLITQSADTLGPIGLIDVDERYPA